MKCFSTKSIEVGMIDDDPVSLVVSDDKNAPGEFIRISSLHDNVSIKYFGEIDLVLNNDFARTLAKAILELTGDK
jgi:hypothetical protein